MSFVRINALKGFVVVGLGRTGVTVLQFGRNLLLARVLSAEDIGIASLLALSMTLLETVTNLAFDTILIQSKFGDRPGFLQSLHALLIARGFLLFAVILLAADLIVALFSVPGAEGVVYLLAVVPLVRGVTHLDIRRFQRHLRFSPLMKIEVTSQALGTVLAWPAAVICGDYSAIVYLLLIQSLVFVVLSHYSAERKYELGWRSSYMYGIFQFGWPLLINGLLIFLMLQGDRLLLGSAKFLTDVELYSMSLIGSYAVAYMLTNTAEEGLWSVINPVGLPLLAKVQDQPAQFERRFSTLIAGVCLVAAPLGILLVMLGDRLVVLIFGSQYAEAALVISWLGLAQSLRLVRRGPTLGALALGDSKVPLYCSFVRASSFVAIFGLVMMGKAVVLIAAMNVIAEIAALALCVSLLNRRCHIRWGAMLKPMLFPLAGFLTALLVHTARGHQAEAVESVIVSLLLIVTLSTAMITFLAELRAEFRLIVSRRSLRETAS